MNQTNGKWTSISKSFWVSIDSCIYNRFGAPARSKLGNGTSPQKLRFVCPGSSKCWPFKSQLKKKCIQTFAWPKGERWISDRSRSKGFKCNRRKKAVRKVDKGHSQTCLKRTKEVRQGDERRAKQHKNGSKVKKGSTARKKKVAVHHKANGDARRGDGAVGKVLPK